jgi:hypothetical protein
MINWTLSTAESTVSKAVEHAIPVAEKMEKTLKRVDTLLCSSLDYVEAKVPAVKLPPHEVHNIYFLPFCIIRSQTKHSTAGL